MDQRDSHCPYLFCCEITAKPTVLVFVLMCCHSRLCHTGSTTHHFYVPINSCVSRVRLELVIRTTAGQEDPFELDSNLLLSVDQHGEDRKRQLNSFNDHETPLLDDLADLLY